jgi:putative ABC transport system ATP-binding protein
VLHLPDHAAASSAPQAIVFRARNLSKVYLMGEVAVHALRDIDLDIYEREFVVLLGPSGSGKSTLLNILGGLDAPTSGEAMWREHDLVNADDTELTRYRREHVGFVFQFYNLIPSLTVLENVALVNEIADRPLDPREALALVGLTERLDHFPSQLSGGEQQRVAVARAIVKSPDVLLCDEPKGALDYETGKFVLAAIARVNDQLGTTTVIITHNAAIAGMADRVLRLAGGQIVGEERNSRRLSPEEVRW